METGLSYFGARYYSSDLSIWLAVDPMSDKYPSLSPYVYCADNPVRCVDPNGEEVINGYAKELSDSQEIVTLLTAKLNCLEKGTKQYKQTKRWLSEELGKLNIIQRKYNIVEGAINDFKKHCPENFDKLNNLSDDNGFDVDVVVSLKYNLNNNLDKGQSDIRRESIFNPRTQKSMYFVPSAAQIYLNPNACLNQDDIGRTLAHEGGHVFYEVSNTAEYATWFINSQYYYENNLST